MKKLILMRHGESVWNRENKFTGWHDIELSTKGEEEALQAAFLLKKKGFAFDCAYTSLLKRAIKTLWILLEELDQFWIPVIRDWRLNERHYGNLQGLNKAETALQYGEEQVFTWRRHFDVVPPAMDSDDSCWVGNDRRYQSLKPEQIPKAESLKDTINRVIPFWKEVVGPCLKKQKTILIVAHGNSLRALIKHLDSISDQKISKLNIATAQPIIYEMKDDLCPLRNYILK